jgi:gas vesicle protein
MSFRTGVVIGALVGAGAAALLARPRPAEAPGEEGAREAAPTTGGPLRETLERVRRQAQEALGAAQEAAREKEDEVRRRFEELAHRSR